MKPRNIGVEPYKSSVQSKFSTAAVSSPAKTPTNTTGKRVRQSVSDEDDEILLPEL